MQIFALLWTGVNMLPTARKVRLRLLTCIAVLASVSEPTATQSFRFLALPFDLRFAIYELCMVKGTVYIAPRPKHDHRYDNVGPFPKKPEWALLRVNRQVRSESAKVLLSKNHFVLRYVDGRECFWSRDVYAAMEAESTSLPGLVRRNLNSVSIAFDNRGYADGPLELADFAMRFFEGKDYEKKGDQILEVHAFMCLNTRRWEFMCEFLSQTSVLRIDITNSYSPLGCCHYVLQAADAMAEGFNNSSFPTRLEISCTKNSSERNTRNDTQSCTGETNGSE